MRVVNDVTGVVEWHTIAFVPFVRSEQEPNAKVKGRARRCGVLQRTLYLSLREAIGASHMGAELKDPIHGFKRAFFRVLLYCCDQMEERSVLCLKSGMCAFPCSTCMVSKEALGKPEALAAPDRRAIITLQRQIELHSGAGGNRVVDRTRRAAFKALDSYNAFIPALACMAGLATPPNHMYKMIAFDALHVRFLFPRIGVLCSSCERRLVSAALALSHVLRSNGTKTGSGARCGDTGSNRGDRPALWLLCCYPWAVHYPWSYPGIGPGGDPDAVPPALPAVSAAV